MPSYRYYIAMVNHEVKHVSNIRIQAVLNEVRKRLDEAVHFNIQELFQEAIRHTRAELSTSEQAQFYNRYIKPMRLNVDIEGNVGVMLGPL